MYACVAALGLAGISHFMVAHGKPLHLIAGMFLMYLGYRAVTIVRHAVGRRMRRRIDVTSGAVLSFFGIVEISQAL